LSVVTPAGVDTQVAEAAVPETVTPELAESLPYSELKARMRAEARNAEESATTTEAPADDQGGQPTEGAVTPEEGGPERDPQTGRFAASPSTEEQQAAEQRTQSQRSYKQPETLEEALRVLDSVRGNLATNITERNAAQQRLQALEAEAARLRQEGEQRQLQQQHARFEDLVARLPAEQQPIARAEYVQRLQQQATNDFVREMQGREQQLAQREFQSAKAEVPALYKDIAGFVAAQYEIPEAELTALVGSKQVQDLINAAQDPMALQQATIAFGQLLDYEATRVQSRVANEKAQRRETKAQTQVRDVPTGVAPGGAQADVVARINNYSREEFEAYKKGLLRAANR
jgi:ribosomal protein L14E/L6E/L27E